MVDRIVLNAGARSRVRRPRLLPHSLSIAVALLCMTAATAHASVLCIKGNSNSAGSFDTLYTGTDVLVYPGTPDLVGMTGSKDANGNLQQVLGWAQLQTNGVATQPGANLGWTNSGASVTSLANAKGANGNPFQTNAGVSTAQSAFGSSNANPCNDGGANADNTVATISDLTDALANIPKAGTDDPNAVHYDTNAAGDKLNDVTLVGGSAGPVGLHNVADGKAVSDAATVGQLITATSDAVTQAGAHTDKVAQTTLNQANNYTDQVAQTTLNQANNYTDQVAQTTLNQANNYTDQVAQTTLKEANAYTDEATKYFKANSNGAAASATGSDAIAVGPDAIAGGDSSVAIGAGSQASGNKAIAIGTGNVVSGNGSGAIGDPNTVSGDGSYAIGNNNSITNDGTFVLGNGVTTTQDNSIVLGNASTDRAATTVAGISINGTNYTFAGQGSAAHGVASIGAAGAERQLINVAAGELTAESTDAVNGSQLYATNQAVVKVAELSNALGKSAAGALGGGAAYDPSTGAISAPTYVINDVAYKDVGSAIGAIPVAANNISARSVASAAGADSTAVGFGASATGNNSVALGSGSVATRDNSVSVGAEGSERQITNVAAGVAATDAVNVGQLNAAAGEALGQANAYTDQRIATVSKQVNAVGAAAMAAAALQPNARAEGNFQMSAGAGTYGGASALAIGAHYWASDRILVNVAVTRAMGAGASTGASIGTTIGF